MGVLSIILALLTSSRPAPSGEGAHQKREESICRKLEPSITPTLPLAKKRRWQLASGLSAAAARKENSSARKIYCRDLAD